MTRHFDPSESQTIVQTNILEMDDSAREEAPTATEKPDNEDDKDKDADIVKDGPATGRVVGSCSGSDPERILIPPIGSLLRQSF